MLRRATRLILACLALLTLGTAIAQEPIPLSTGKLITPQGIQTPVGSFPVNMLLSPDGRFIVVTNSGAREYLTVLSVETGKIVSQIAYNAKRTDGSDKHEGLYYGLAFGPKTGDVHPLYASRGAEDRVGVLTLDAAGKLTDTATFLENPSGIPNFKEPHTIAGLALSPNGRRIYAANNNAGPFSKNKSSISILDPAQGREPSKIEVPGFPFEILAVGSGARGAAEKLYVTSERDGVVAVVDPARPSGEAVTKRLPTGDHPLRMVLNKNQSLLFVANSGSDTVSVITTADDHIIDTILLRPDDARGLPGATPTGLALSTDERQLFVTLGDMNAVAVVQLAPDGKGKLIGLIPVGWYPTSVIAAPDGKQIFVSNAKGVNARIPNKADSGPAGAWGKYINDIIEGTVSMIDLPDEAQLAKLTEQTIRNNFLSPGMETTAAAKFDNPGIEHVFYVIKENRTYDQVLGDLGKGNGDPDLCLFPREVTPNQHALAERFVLLDNFYVCAEVSADGWGWSTSGMISEYAARNTPYNYSDRGRLYDYEGQNNGVPVDLLGLPDVARPASGYIWDHCISHRVSFRNYGFFNAYTSPDVTAAETGPDGRPIARLNAPTKKALEGQTDKNFMLFAMSYADSDAWIRHNVSPPNQLLAYGDFSAPSRIAEFRREFEQYVKNGDLPKFIMLRLPRNHTAGTAAGVSSPRAMVADNDFAVGQLVELVSRSPYWKKSAIFILEDDAQAGHDHVDAHRSIAFVISPFVRRATVDSRFYNTDSMLRTMELLLGMPPMNQFDATAPPMRVFADAAGNDAAYEPILPDKAIIAEVNKQTAYRSEECERLNFETADAVPDAILTDILWNSIKGQDIPQPEPRYNLRIARSDDDEREESEAKQEEDGDTK